MPAPRRPRQTKPSQRPAPALTPLGDLISEHEKWRSSLPGKPSRGALRDHWQKKDAQHALRPDYLLWRETQCTDSPPQRRQDIIDLTIRALKAPEPMIHWAALTLLADVMQVTASLPAAKKENLLQALRHRLGTERQSLQPIASTPYASALILWLARSFLEPDRESIWAELQTLIQKAQPEWKLGRKIDLHFWEAGLTWPLSRVQIMRRLGVSIHRLVTHQTLESKAKADTLAPWHLNAWMLLRDTRSAQSPARVIELEVLLGAATTSRLAGDADQAARLTTLALHLLPAQMPEPLMQRCRVAAWTLMEAGFTVPPPFTLSLDELPFPGDPPSSENGQAAARQYLDESDIYQVHLTKEVQNDPDWEILRQANVNLQHPLAALSWVARKAQAYALKKQQELLQSAILLATRHQRLTTLGRLLPHVSATPDLVMNYAQTLRQSQRRMPFLRDQEIWLDWTRSLRLAWARLEPQVTLDPEQLFLLHETLLDREVTLLRCLPQELRVLALRHLHSRHQPSLLVQALAAEPRNMQQLEHQRQVELWSVAAELRERPELATTVWLSLVMRGDPAQGRYSLIVQGSTGRVIHQDRLKPKTPPSSNLDWSPLLDKIIQSLPQVNSDATSLLVAMDPSLDELPWPAWLREAGLNLPVNFIPSWEWAFRVLRESPSAPLSAGDWLQPESTPLLPAESLPTSSLPPGTCVLLPTHDGCDANTRWAALNDPDTPPRRSLQIGAYERIISGMPVKQGPLKQDLTRLSLGQHTRCFITPPSPLTEAERTTFQSAPLNPPETWTRQGLG